MIKIDVRPVAVQDISSLKEIIASNDIFPPDMLDDMTKGYLSGNVDSEIWLTNPAVQGILYCKAEYLTQGTANLLLLAVTDTEHRKGFGTALLHALELQLREAGFHLLIVETSTQETYGPARAFYQRNGFQPVATINDYYTKGEGKIIYTKYL